jgi:hypothetical protein
MSINNAELISAIELLKSKKIIKRDAEISEAIGYTKGLVSLYVNNKKEVSELFMRKFYEKYPEAKKNKQSLQNRTLLNSNAVLVKDGDFPTMIVPVVSQFAYAGYLHGYADEEYMHGLPKMPWPVEGEHKGAYITFQVRGDSMDDDSKDSYSDGDLLLCREIARNLWEKSKLHIKKWDFVIVHKTEGILIKRITEHNVEKGLITIHSLNDFYPDQQIKLQDVSQIFNVVQSLRKR